MKLLRDFFRWPLVQRWFGGGRRQAAKRTITVPAPLSAADAARVLDLRLRTRGACASNDTFAGRLPQRTVNQR